MEGASAVNARLRQLPAVDVLVDLADREGNLARWSLLAAARIALTDAREGLLAGSGPSLEPEQLAADVRELARALERPFPRRVVNATGVVLHTNLGRAPLAAEAVAAMQGALAGYTDLELDVETGERGSRLSRVTPLLCLLSGAEAATVVNNNAGAMLLALDAIAAGREVVLSRGEMVEIGGSFRVPEIMESSRARLREIGTTNRTHLRDYARAIGPETGALLKVHRSNFEIRGFTHEVSLAELAPLAREHGIPLIEDRGSGSFVDLTPLGIPEREVQQGLRDGADLVLFSGDKLLGGPQAGVVLGRRDLVEQMRKSPIARALRVDKMTLSVLHWQLRVLLAGEARSRIPVLRMLLPEAGELEARARRLAQAIGQVWGGEIAVEQRGSPVGGGALPEVELESWVVRIEGGRSAAALGHALRRNDPPILARIQQNALLLDPRTLAEDEIAVVAAALASVRD